MIQAGGSLKDLPCPTGLPGWVQSREASWLLVKHSLPGQEAHPRLAQGSVSTGEALSEADTSL